jgi:hypothetical protein
MKQYMNSVAGFIRVLSQGKENESILFGNFLDDFYRANNEERAKMLIDEPEAFDNLRSIDYINIAATAHKLANDSGIPVPEWTFKEKYYAKEPYFPVQNPNLRLIYMFESPTEFKHRNLFVSANALFRV